jgi:hypothetical protein
VYRPNGMLERLLTIRLVFERRPYVRDFLQCAQAPLAVISAGALTRENSASSSSKNSIKSSKLFSMILARWASLRYSEQSCLWSARSMLNFCVQFVCKFEAWSCGAQSHKYPGGRDNQKSLGITFGQVKRSRGVTLSDFYRTYYTRPYNWRHVKHALFDLFSAHTAALCRHMGF